MNCYKLRCILFIIYFRWKTNTHLRIVRTGLKASWAGVLQDVQSNATLTAFTKITDCAATIVHVTNFGSIKEVEQYPNCCLNCLCGTNFYRFFKNDGSMDENYVIIPKVRGTTIDYHIHTVLDGVVSGPRGKVCWTKSNFRTRAMLGDVITEYKIEFPPNADFETKLRTIALLFLDFSTQKSHAR